MFQFAIIATTVELTLCLACSILLWMRRRETGDRSRHVLAGVSFTCVLWSIGKFFEYIGHPDANIYTNILSPEHCFWGLLCMILYFFYPVMIMRPRWFMWRWVLLFMLPWLLLSPPYLCQMPFRSLTAANDIVTCLSEFNVWWRLLTVVIIIGYLILLLVLPFNRWRSSANSQWVRSYSLAVAVMAVLYFGYQLTLWMPIHLAHQVYVGLFFVYYTYFELEERLMPVKDILLTSQESETTNQQIENSLWQRIICEVDEKHVWKDPDLNIDILARLVGSNKTYVHRAFAENSQQTYNDYINRCRVDYIAGQLRQRPNQNLESLFFSAGYRSRQTARRNFKELMGVTPSEYAASL